MVSIFLFQPFWILELLSRKDSVKGVLDSSPSVV